MFFFNRPQKNDRSRFFEDSRLIFALSLPSILSNLTVPLLSMVDTGYVGNFLSPVDLAGISLGALIFNVLFWCFGFLKMGTVGPTAIAAGAENRKESDSVLWRGLLIAFSTGILFNLFSDKILDAALFFFDAEENAELSARVYLENRLPAAPATLGLFVFFGWFLGLGQPKYPLYILLASNFLNLGLDHFFTVNLRLGLEGIAHATVLSQYFGLLIAFGILLKTRPDAFKNFRQEQGFTKEKWLAFFKLNTDIFIRTALLTLSLAIFTNLSAKMGNDILSANSIFLQIWTFTAYFLDGFAHTAENLAGKSIGEKSIDKYRGYKKLLFFWSSLTASFLSLILFVFDEAIFASITEFDSVRESASEYFFWLWFCPIVGNYCYMWDGIFVGSTDSVSIRKSMIFNFTVFIFGVFIFSFFFTNNHFLWGIMILFTLLRGVSLRHYASVREFTWFAEKKNSFGAACQKK